MNKSTVVSVCNFPIVNEYKPTVFPAYYTIPEADPEFGFSILTVENGWCPEYLGEDRSIRRDIFSKEIADAIVLDYQIAQICIHNGRPGLFAVEGEYTEAEIKKQFKEELKQAKATDTTWARDLVTMGDDLWAIKKQHRQITNSMRFAAKFLGLNREWVEISHAAQAINCPACSTQLSADSALCYNCKCVIDPTKYAELQFAS